MFIGIALTIFVAQKIGSGAIVIPDFLRLGASTDVLLLNASGDKLIL
jgi:hypothetical protein